MIFKDKDSNNFLEFYPISYEFPNLTKDRKDYDIDDANWLNIVFNSAINGKQYKEIFPCFQTMEIYSFIEKIEKEIDEDFSISLSPLEPYFDITITKEKDIITIYSHYYYGNISKNEKVEIKMICNKKELKLIIEEFKNEYENYPIR